MPWCPKCHYEYRAEITICPDCEVELTEDPPSHDPVKISLISICLEISAFSMLLPLVGYGSLRGIYTAVAFVANDSSANVISIVAAIVLSVTLLLLSMRYGQLKGFDMSSGTVIASLLAAALLNLVVAAPLLNLFRLDPLSIAVYIPYACICSGASLFCVWYGAS